MDTIPWTNYRVISDYILTNEMCMELKSLVDLIESVECSGGVYSHQVSLRYVKISATWPLLSSTRKLAQSIPEIHVQVQVQLSTQAVHLLSEPERFIWKKRTSVHKTVSFTFLPER